MKFSQCIQVLLALLFFGLSLGDVRADGGVIRLREAQGPFVVTVFTASEPLRDSFTDVSILVQRRDSSDAILDATVDLTFTAPPESVVKPIEQMCGKSGEALLSPTSESHKERFTIPATRKQASNKLLYAAPVKFDASGNWRLQAIIERGSDNAKLACDIPVGLPPRRLADLFPYLTLPLLLIPLFAVNQWLRKQPSEKNVLARIRGVHATNGFGRTGPDSGRVLYSMAGDNCRAVEIMMLQPWA